MTKQIAIMLNSQDEFEGTGIIGWIELFGSPHYNIVIRPGVVIVDGCAMMSPDKTRTFAKALDTAARLAEEHYGQKVHKIQNDGDEDIT